MVPDETKNGGVDNRAHILLRELDKERREREPDRGKVEAILRELGQLVSNPSQNRRQSSLTALYYYHSGTWASVVGDYGRAVYELELSAHESESEGDAAGAANSRRCAEVYRLWEALEKGQMHDLTEIQTSARKVVELCGKSYFPQRRYWALANAPVHVLLAHIWTLTPITAEEEKYWFDLFEQLRLIDGVAYANLQRTIIVLEAGTHLLNRRYELAEEVIHSFSMACAFDDEQLRMTARWIEFQAKLELLVAEENNVLPLRVLTKQILNQI